MNLKNLRILYVEDDDIIRTEFAEALNRIFGKVIVSINGSEALSIYQEFSGKNIDLIISDVDMPVMNGLTLLEKIREHDNKIPFIFTTAHSEVDFLLKAISLNISEYLIKPINTRALKSKVEILFGKIFKENNKLNKHEEMSEYVSIINQVAIVSRTDENGIITDVNDFFCEVSGYSKEELIGSNHNIVRHPNNAKLFYENMWNELKQGNIWKGKIKNLSKNGEDYFLISTIIPISNENKITEYVGVKFLTTEIEVKNREFKKKVMYNLQETKRINTNARKKIDELEDELKKFKHVDLLKNVFENEKIKNSELLSRISTLENDIYKSDVRIDKIARESKAKVSQTEYLLKQEKFKNEYIFCKFGNMQLEIDKSKEEITQLNNDLTQKNKKIIDLSDVLNHREDQLNKFDKKNVK